MYFAPVPSGPRRAQDKKKIFHRLPYTTGSYPEIYLPILPFFSATQLAIFRIEYNPFSKAKFGNFHKLLKLNIYLQTIITGEKTKFELNSTSLKLSLASGGSAGNIAIGKYWKTLKIAISVFQHFSYGKSARL